MGDERGHRAIYAAFDRFPSPKGAATHIGQMASTLFETFGGGLLYVPEHWITPADVGIEAVTSIYVSMGLTSPQYLPRADKAQLTAPETPPRAV